MGIKLINKNIPKKCEYCLYAKSYAGSNNLLCKYRGVVNSYDNCRKYKYDILKRTPHTQEIGNDYSAEDFNI